VHPNQGGRRGKGRGLEVAQFRVTGRPVAATGGGAGPSQTGRSGVRCPCRPPPGGGRSEFSYAAIQEKPYRRACRLPVTVFMRQGALPQAAASRAGVRRGPARESDRRELERSSRSRPRPPKGTALRMPSHINPTDLRAARMDAGESSQTRSQAGSESYTGERFEAEDQPATLLACRAPSRRNPERFVCGAKLGEATSELRHMGVVRRWADRVRATDEPRDARRCPKCGWYNLYEPASR